ncbi:MAG TPA: MerR family transcriptional regulator [Bellilinea sp.]|nr:MerR family transcriptional regulator [Bellilinea sp.]
MKQDFQISELAEAAQTSVRTVRYYLEMGLLPLPAADGKFSVFSDDHLNRLRLIALLKESYLPLREIREILLSMAPQDVVDKLKELKKGESKKERSHKSSNARDYIQNLIDEQNVLRNQRSLHAPQPRLIKESQASQGAIDLQGETWQKVQVKEGVEIAFSQSLPTEDQARVREIILFAKKIFNIQ